MGRQFDSYQEQDRIALPPVHSETTVHCAVSKVIVLVNPVLTIAGEIHAPMCCGVYDSECHYRSLSTERKTIA